MSDEKCSFCGKGKDDVEILIKSSDEKNIICSECVEMSKQILKESGPSKRKILRMSEFKK